MREFNSQSCGKLLKVASVVTLFRISSFFYLVWRLRLSVQLVVIVASLISGNAEFAALCLRRRAPENGKDYAIDKIGARFSLIPSILIGSLLFGFGRLHSQNGSSPLPMYARRRYSHTIFWLLSNATVQTDSMTDSITDSIYRRFPFKRLATRKSRLETFFD